MDTNFLNLPNPTNPIVSIDLAILIFLLHNPIDSSYLIKLKTFVLY